MMTGSDLAGCLPLAGLALGSIISGVIMSSIHSDQKMRNPRQMSYNKMQRLNLLCILMLLCSLLTGCGTTKVAYISKDTAASGQCTLHKLRAIVIDEVEFRQANLHDVLEFIQKRVKECEPPHKDGQLIVLGLCPPNPPPEVQVNGDPFSVGQKVNNAEITFSARHISLYDLTDSVCRLAGYEWSIDKKGTIMFREKGNIKLGNPAASQH